MIDGAAGDWLQSISSWAAGGAGLGGGFFAAKWLIEFISGRIDRRTAALDAGVQGLLDGLQGQVNGLLDRLGRLTARLDLVEQKWRECEEKHLMTLEELARLRGASAGLGDARQHAQTIIAADKLKERGEI